MDIKKILRFLLSLVILVFSIFFSSKIEKDESNCSIDYVTKIYDGDTILTRNLGKIRILGIDTPEIYHAGWTKIKDYKLYACGKYGLELANKYLLNKNIKVCFDKLSSKTGGYGRNLAYIFFTGDENKLQDFGKILVEKGYARVYKSANFKYKNEYLKLEKIAKKQKIGIWSEKCIQEDKKFKQLKK